MAEIGYFLSCEEFGPAELLDQAERAANHGLTHFVISDHFHPWIDAQGQSPFVWSMLGALARFDLPLMTGVTCTTTRIHPAILAQAAATTAVLTGGRFTFGIGTGEALNEHILGDPWPSLDERLDRMEESVAVMRELWGGELVNRRGEFYKVDTARIYTLPDEPPPVFVSAFGTKAAELAGRIGDGLVSTRPDEEVIAAFRDSGGSGKPMQALVKFAYAPSVDEGVSIALEKWPTEFLSGQAGQELPLPSHFEAAAELVDEDVVRSSPTVCGPEPEEYVKAIRAYADAGFERIAVATMGPHQEEFMAMVEREVVPAL